MSEDWLKSAQFLWFVHGNYDSKDAVEIVDQARKILEVRPASREHLSEVRCIALEPGTRYRIEIPLEDKTNENNCVIAYYEHGIEGMDLRSKLIHEVLMHYLREPTFHQLRTIE